MGRHTAEPLQYVARIYLHDRTLGFLFREILCIRASVCESSHNQKMCERRGLVMAQPSTFAPCVCVCVWLLLFCVRT